MEMSSTVFPLLCILTIVLNLRSLALSKALFRSCFISIPFVYDHVSLLPFVGLVQ